MELKATSPPIPEPDHLNSTRDSFFAPAFAFPAFFSHFLYFFYVRYGMFIRARILPKMLRCCLFVYSSATLFTIFIKPSYFLIFLFFTIFVFFRHHIWLGVITLFHRKLSPTQRLSTGFPIGWSVIKASCGPQRTNVSGQDGQGYFDDGYYHDFRPRSGRGEPRSRFPHFPAIRRNRDRRVAFRDRSHAGSCSHAQDISF
jgi:hypothetical protein